MLSWPSALPAPRYKGFDEDHPDQTISSVSEAGYRISRPRTTRMPGRWTGSWTALTDEQYQMFEAFWKSVHGTSEMFTWMHPKFGTTHTVRFLSKSKFVLTEYGWQGAVEVEEV